MKTILQKRRSRLIIVQESSSDQKETYDTSEQEAKENPEIKESSEKDSKNEKPLNIEEVANTLNTIAFLVIFLTMFISNMYIWIFLSTPD